MTRWLGGGSGAGKSTVARHLAARHGLRVHPTDETMLDHARRSTPRQAPHLHTFLAMDMDERWVTRSPEVMLETFHWFRGECFDLIVEDLRRLDPPVIAEGFRLLPHLVEPQLTKDDRAAWLLPTPEFRRAAFDRRGWDIPARTSDPARARANLLERDRLFTDRLRAECARLRLPTVEVTPAVTEAELTARVADLLAL